MMLGFVSQGLGFGLAAGLTPGPLMSYLVNTTLSYGWRRGLAVVFAPLIADLPIIIVMTFILQTLPDQVADAIQLVGGVYVLYLAWLTYQSYRAGETIGASEEVAIPVSARRTLFQAIGINYLSPGPYIFWASVCGPILRDALSHSLLHAALFFLAFYGSFLLILTGWVIAFDRLRRVDPRVTRGALLLSIIVLALLGVQLILQVLL